MPEPLAADLCRRVVQHQVDWRAPAVAAAVVRDGVLAWSHTVGQADVATGAAADEDTQFRIGSITKTFTAVLVMQLRDEGKLGLDDRLGEHLPGTRHGDLTIRRMLCHLSGLQREPVGEIWERAEGPDRATMLAGVEQAEAVSPPGARWHYSNLAYALLGEVVARLRGTTWEEALARHVLQPLGMKRTTLRRTPPYAVGYLVDPYADRVRMEPEFPGNAFAPAVELWSTLEDLGRWAAFVADSDPAVLSADTLEEMTHPQVMRDLEGWTLGWGLGFMLRRRGERVLVGHDGAMPGFLAGLAVRRPERTGSVVFANCTSGAAPGELAVELTLEAVDGWPAGPAPWRPGPPVPPELEELLGIWWSEGNEFVFFAEGGQLRARLRAARPGPQTVAVFAPIGPDRYRTVGGREHGELLRVVRDASGRVEKLYWATYPFTRDPRPFGQA